MSFWEDLELIQASSYLVMFNLYDIIKSFTIGLPFVWSKFNFMVVYLSQPNGAGEWLDQSRHKHYFIIVIIHRLYRFC